jgi:prepilin-type N-terminal cleavage/methylation domain-containing protein
MSHESMPAALRLTEGLCFTHPKRANVRTQMKFQRGFTIIELYVVLLLFGGIGWICNIVKIVQNGFDVITGMFIARCIGVFVAPLGAVLGFL